MSNSEITKTIGADASCDMVLDHAELAPVHARLELAPDGLVCLSEESPATPVFLRRNDQWIRVRRSTLCIGDRIRLAGLELPIQRLTAVFGERSNARLGSIRLSFQGGRHGRGLLGSSGEPGGQLKRPRRNPVTGKIEEEQAAKGGSDIQ